MKDVFISTRSTRTPRWTRRLAKYVVIAFALFLIALGLAPWRQTAVGGGRVVALSPDDRRQNIDAPLEGRLGQWLVQEGSSVKAGDPIVELSDNDPQILSRLTDERNALARRLKAIQSAARTSQINVDRQQELFNQGISARRSFEQAELDYARYLTEEANASAELARIEVRLARQGNQVVRAPRAGTILHRLSGQQSVMVKSGETLAVLIPETDSRAAEIWVRGNDVPLVQPGQEARLQFEGWPAIQFSGWPGLAAGTFKGRVAYVDASDDGTGRFRVLVRPDPGQKWPEPSHLRQGVRCNAWILLNEVPLAFELWRVFNGFPPSLVEKPETSEAGKTGKK